MNIYRFLDYKDLIKRLIREKHGRGVLKELAEAANCQRSYLSQALNTHVHLTPDQALGVSQFFKFNDEETSFFLTLVDYARAGSPALKKRLKANLDRIRKKSEDLESRIAAPIVQTNPTDVAYYSSWLWPAVHMAVSIPKLQTSEALSFHFNVPELLIVRALEGLFQMGFVKKSGSRWIYDQGERHLSKYSALVSMNHANWRQRAVISAQSQVENSFHYTSVSAMSEADYLTIKDLVLKATENVRVIAKESKEEAVVCFNVDFFKI